MSIQRLANKFILKLSEINKIKDEKSELIDIISKLTLKVNPGQQKYLGILYQLYVRGLSPTEITDTSPNQKYQWKKEGLKLVWPYASDNLKDFLRRGVSHSFTKSDENMADAPRREYVSPRDLSSYNYGYMTQGEADDLASPKMTQGET